MKTKYLLLITLILLLTIHQSIAESWEYWPQLNKTIKEAGYIGGEGGQVVQAIACDQISGTFLLAGADVGGLNKSIDGGVTWEPANVGFNCEGVCSFAMDPNNIDRALVVGGNSGPPVFDPVIHGLYLTTDRGSSWSLVLPAKIAGYRDMRDQIVFDKSSFDPAKGYSTIAYWSRADQAWAQWGNPQVHPALYKSMDGGLTWHELPGTEEYGGALLRVHPVTGQLYAGNSRGLFISKDGAESFEKIFDEPVTGLDVINSFTDNVYWTSESGLYVSENSCNTFTKIETSRFPTPHASGLMVSPVDPLRMVLNNQRGEWYEQDKYFSHDGGVTWKTAVINNKYAFLPFNGRMSRFAWHPLNSDIVWGLGGDWVTRSSNGGKTFDWAYNGISAVLQTGKFNFSVEYPDVVLITTQDYDCSITLDGGSTWKYLNMSKNGWGGFFYGGYALNSRIMFAAERPGWDGIRKIVITWDGGKTFTKTDYIVNGSLTGYSAPGDTNRFFLGDLWSKDQGKTWKKMDNCDGVFTSNPIEQKELYGISEKRIVVSFDKGDTWEDVTDDFSHDLLDIGIDHVNRLLYIAGGDHLYKYDINIQNLEELSLKVPVDQLGNRKFTTVAVDPVDPSVVYAGGNHDIYVSDCSVVRSLDNGNTWHSINVSKRLGTGQFGMDGGKEAFSMRVHPITRYLHVGTMCHGQWKFSPPGTSSVINSNKSLLPGLFDLFQNYPNPFNPDTCIKFNLFCDAFVKVNIVNIKGEKVKSICEQRLLKGNYSFKWHGKTEWGSLAASGVYFCVVEADDSNRSIKLLLIR